MAKDIFGYIPPRPTARTTDLSEAIKELAEQVFHWCNEQSPIEDIEEDIKSVLEFSWNRSDGFELAKAMDDKGYSADSELVEIMNGAHWIIDKCVNKAIKKWVKDYSIHTEYEVGKKITLPSNILREEKDMEGEITSIDTEKATYTICIPELGHVKEGLGTHGRVYKFEVVHDFNLDLIKK